jgi:hypothetical protein
MKNIMSLYRNEKNIMETKKMKTSHPCKNIMGTKKEENKGIT